MLKETATKLKPSKLEKMEYVIPALILIILCASVVGAWRSNTDKLTDHDLYGMSSEDYLKKQVGEDYYNKYYKY